MRKKDNVLIDLHYINERSKEEIENNYDKQILFFDKNGKPMVSYITYDQGYLIPKDAIAYCYLDVGIDVVIKECDEIELEKDTVSEYLKNVLESEDLKFSDILCANLHNHNRDEHGIYERSLILKYQYNVDDFKKFIKDLNTFYKYSIEIYRDMVFSGTILFKNKNNIQLNVIDLEYSIQFEFSKIENMPSKCIPF